MENQPSYRPGRIQTITGEQEIVLKQVWAHFLRYWGYGIDMTKSELRNTDCFVASVTTEAFGQSNEKHKKHRLSLHSLHSLTSRSKTKSRGKNSKGKASNSRKLSVLSEASEGGARQSRRLSQMMDADHEEYVPGTPVLDRTYKIFMYYYQALFEHAYSTGTSFEENTHSDSASAQTYTTAATSMNDDDHHDHGDGDGVHAHKNSHVRTISAEPESYQAAASNYAAVRPPLSTMEVHPKIKTFTFMNTGDVRAIHKCFFKIFRQDLVDNYVLRFTRARKFDYKKACEMLFATLRWRSEHFPCTDWLMEGDALAYLKNTSPGLVKNFTREKIWLSRSDLEGNPLIVFVARNHFAGDSSSAELQRYAVVLTEWTRMKFREVTASADLASLVFDLTGFSLKNADYHGIKFLADLYAAHYPESLGTIMIFNAPWIFTTVWNIIKNWLDPVVASKIHFTKNIKQLQKFVDIDNIPISLGGKNTVEGKYVFPEARDISPPKPKDAQFAELTRQRDLLCMRLIDTTKRWIHATNPHVSAQYLQDKIDLDVELSENYIQMDPYIRCRGIYDRSGALKVQN